jgi:hypothetical protein
MHKPKLRPLEAIPIQKDLICLRDPMQVSDKMLFLAPHVFYLCTLFDGENSLEEIEAQYSRSFNVALSRDELQSVIDKLEDVFFLDSENFRKEEAGIIEAFKKSPVRPSSHAGTAYHDDPEKLIEQLDALFTVEGGPGLPFPTIKDDSPSPAGRNQKNQDTIPALVAPHIDINRGGACFAHSYFELAGACFAHSYFELAGACRSKGPVTFIIFGISHMAASRRFILTKKDFATPLGSVPVNGEFLDRLTAGTSIDFFEDEMVHRTEHSIEFQVLFLKYLFKERDDISIVPILCSSLNDLFTRDTSPADDPEIAQFHKALLESVRSHSRTGRGNVYLIAGVDLAHLGSRFGQDVEVTEQLLQWAEEEDRNMLDLVLECDSEGFYSHIKKEQDKRNVCGVPAIYTMLTILNRLNGTHANPGRLIKYDMAADTSTNSVVTFAGVSFYC